MKKGKLKRLLNEALDELGAVRSRLASIESRMPPRSLNCGAIGGTFWFVDASVPSPDLVTRDMVRQIIAADKQLPVTRVADVGVSTVSAVSPAIPQSPEPFPESFTRQVDLPILNRVNDQFCSLCAPNAPGSLRRRIEDCQHGTGSADGKRQFEEKHAARAIAERQSNQSNGRYL